MWPPPETNDDDGDNDGGGAWIGIDFGTTHSCAAVWDSTRGRPKALRLESALPEGAKRGRLVPTALVLVRAADVDRVSSLFLPRLPAFYTTDELQSLGLAAVVGAPALRLLHDLSETLASSSSSSISPEQVSAAMITNLKLHFSGGVSAAVSSAAATSSETTTTARTTTVEVTPIGASGPIRIESGALVQAFLAALKRESESYLRRDGRRKRLAVPRGARRRPPHSKGAAADDAQGEDPAGRIDHAVIGVPCQWNQTLRHRLERISVAGGGGRQREPPKSVAATSSSSRDAAAAVEEWEPFRSAAVLSEPTAAGLSYGLGVSARQKAVMVVDMGGGTTDVTVARLSDESQRVEVAVGSQVGGNDVDRAILEWFLRRSESSSSSPSRTPESLSEYERRLLLRACKDAKEELCTRWSTKEHVDVSFRDWTVRLDQASFEAITEPILARAEATVALALDKYRVGVGEEECSPLAIIDEVVLVGGTTKIPAVADLLRRATGCQELCQVHPLTAVAQGAAIHAARLSSCVPARELRSALLLDALPYAIGVKMATPPTASASPALALPPSENRSDFVPVLAQYASVPATGSVRFALANKEQTGVTVPVVECIDDGGGHRQFETIETFQFLLRKLSMEELQSLSERFVEIRIRFTELGQLIVTAVDEHDPDHRRKYQLVGDADDEGRSKGLPRPIEDAPPVGLIVTAVSLVILYVAVKLAFHEVELKRA